jgi:predicted deacetylase
LEYEHTDGGIVFYSPCTNYFVWVCHKEVKEKIKNMNKILSVGIIAVVITFFVSEFFVDLKSVAQNSYNASLVSVSHSSCRPPVTIGFRHKIVLRIDDVQTNWLTSVQRRMILDAEARGLQVSLGVIPATTDPREKFFNFLKSKTCMSEIALHGWDHSYPNGKGEFALLSREEAEEKIVRGKRHLENIFGVTTNVFIPPYNEISSGTVEALRGNGFEIISALGDSTYDFDVTTFDFNEMSHVGAKEILNECTYYFEEQGYCVVMIHPSDFVTSEVLDEHKYEQYIKLLNGIRSIGADTVSFDQLSKNLKTQPLISKN